MRMVFLPGMSGHGSFWQPVVDRLPGHECRLVDWPGLGGHPPDDDVESYDDLVDRALGDDDDDDEPMVLVAQSRGGYVALQAALRSPERVSHLVLAATSGGLDPRAFGATDWRPGSRAAHPDAPEWAFAPTPDLSDRLTGLAVPTLLVWATADAISPLALGEQLDALLPRSQLLVLDSDDHWVAHHEAATVAAAIERFVAVS